MGNHSFRYFSCGEYGDKSGRPHYHVILFGQDFHQDRVVYSKTNNGDLLFRSAFLDRVWSNGLCVIGDVTFDSCAYVARYVMKKRKGKDDYVDPETGISNADYYHAVVEETGEFFELEPEFCLMSRRPGIGADWYAKFKSDTDKDFITLNGVKMSLPKYYDYLLQKNDEEELEYKKRNRRKVMKIHEDDNTLERLHVKKEVKLAQLNFLNREKI